MNGAEQKVQILSILPRRSFHPFTGYMNLRLSKPLGIKGMEDFTYFSSLDIIFAKVKFYLITMKKKSSRTKKNY